MLRETTDSGYNFNIAMSCFCGDVVTIDKVYCNFYTIEDDERVWYWTDEMIEGLVKDEDGLTSVITREFLLANKFDFRIYDDSKFPDGEYTKRVGGCTNIIRIGYSDLFKWDYEIHNFDKLIHFKADRQDNIHIDTLQKLLDLAEVELKLI